MKQHPARPVYTAMGPRGHRPACIRPALIWLLIAGFLVGGCASRRPAAEAPSGAATVGQQPADPAAPPEPQWRTTGEAPGVQEAAREPAPLAQGAPAFTPFSLDMPSLSIEVAAICNSARLSKQKDFLPQLVTDLYDSGVDPALATEALIKGDCGPLAQVVREMVAQGGDEVVPAVVNSARALAGPKADRVIKTAVSAGLQPGPAPLAQQAGPPKPSGSLPHSMAYFPSGAESAALETANAANMLYSQATPGFGIYTFVLLGAGFHNKNPSDQLRFGELLRVIETYVLAGGQGAQGPSRESHAFLIAVAPDRADQRLAEQTGPERTEPMRRDLVQYLRRQGQGPLADRLETRPGPFLVSSLEPRLIPTSGTSPRLVTDLSAIGTEYMYAVVDAYDRPVPLDTGRFEALNPIRDRLLGLFSRKVPEEDLSPATMDAWVFRLGGLPAEPEVQAARTLGADPSLPVMDETGGQVPVRSEAPGAADSLPPPAAQPAPQSDVLTTPPRS